MNQRYCLDLPTPVLGFMDSFLLVNGRLGSTVRPDIGEERIERNLDRFWSGGPASAVRGPSPAHRLPQLRQARRNGDSARAEALGPEMQWQGWTRSYQPLRPARNSNPTTNINTEMNYWPTQVTGLGDLAEEASAASLRRHRPLIGDDGELWEWGRSLTGGGLRLDCGARAGGCYRIARSEARRGNHRAGIN